MTFHGRPSQCFTAELLQYSRQNCSNIHGRDCPSSRGACGRVDLASRGGNVAAADDRCAGAAAARSSRIGAELELPTSTASDCIRPFERSFRLPPNKLAGSTRPRCSSSGICSRHSSQERRSSRRRGLLVGLSSGLAQQFGARSRRRGACGCGRPIRRRHAAPHCPAATHRPGRAAGRSSALR